MLIRSCYAATYAAAINMPSFISWRGMPGWGVICKSTNQSLSRTRLMRTPSFNVYFSLRIASGIVTPASLCKIWFRYQAVTVQLLLVAVEVSLMHRIYALFLQNCWILSLLIILGIAQLLSMVISARLVIPNTTYSETCYVIKPHVASVYFGATTITTNSAILFMLSWRYLHLPVPKPEHLMKFEALRAVIRIVLRDSTLSILAILVITLLMMLSNLGVIELSLNGNITYPWLFCILWISFGRLVVNHAKAIQVQVEKSRERDQSNGQWTSRIQVERGAEIQSWMSELSTARSSQSHSHTQSSHSHIHPDPHTISLKALGVLAGRSPDSLAEEGSLHSESVESAEIAKGIEVVEDRHKKQIQDRDKDRDKEKGKDKGIPLVPSDTKETGDSCS
ncbi:hypothetical protein V8B97DRAFT_1982751 [Scleroderma yunnanense]